MMTDVVTRRLVFVGALRSSFFFFGHGGYTPVARVACLSEPLFLRILDLSGVLGSHRGALWVASSEERK